MAHLLIVEDDELLRDGLSAQLMQAGHRIDTAADGEQDCVGPPGAMGQDRGNARNPKPRC